MAFRRGMRRPMARRRVTRRYAPRRTTKKKVAPVTRTFRAKVKRVIKSQLETKNCNYTSGTLALSSSSGVSWLVNSVWPLSPFTNVLDIRQGVGEAMRIGNKVRTVKLSLKLVVWPSQYDATTNPAPQPYWVIVYIFVAKNYQTVPMPLASSFADFYQQNNTSASFSDTCADLIRPINTEAFTMKRIVRFKVGYASNDGTGVSNARQFESSNDFPLSVVKTMDLTKYCPKQVVYDDNVGFTTSHLLQMAIQVVSYRDNVNGTGVIPLRGLFQLDYLYKDA